MDDFREATSPLQIDAIVGDFTKSLKRQFSDYNKQREELKAENERCKRRFEELKEEAERLREDLEKEKETRSKEKDTWTKERDRWKVQARQLRAELSEKVEDIEGLQNKIRDTDNMRRAGLEVVVADTIRFWQSAQAAQEVISKQTQRVLLIQLDQIMREELQPRSIDEILELLVREDDGMQV